MKLGRGPNEKSTISLLFKLVEIDFKDRALDDVHFICEDGLLIEQGVEKAMSSNERVNLPIKIIGIVPKVSNDPVLIGKLTLSMKKSLKGDVAL